MNDELTKAIMSAGRELGDKNDWVFENGSSAPDEKDGFVETLRRHIEPLLGDGWKRARIAVLMAELVELEKE